jgi:hypothetical protein
MIDFRKTFVSGGRAATLAVAGVAFAGVTLAPRPGLALFVQQSNTEGVIAQDIGGIWLSVHDVMPEFGSQIRREEGDKTIPFKIGPLGEALKPFIGPDAKGVMVTEIPESASAELGILQDDMIIALNSQPVADEADFERELAKAQRLIVLTVRRPAIGFTTTRLLKVQWEAVHSEDENSSALVETPVRVQVMDVKLPFQQAVNDTRNGPQTWAPSKEVLEDLEANWWQLPPNDPAAFVKGEHRVVAADHYDSALVTDDISRGKMFAITSDLTGNPLLGGGRSVVIYGVGEVAGDRIRGDFIEAALGAAPFPISVEFKGRFTWYRIDDYSNKDVEAASAERKANQEQDMKNYEVLPDVPAGLK